MFNLYIGVYVALLFFVLTPGVLLSLPPKASKMTVAITHAVVFAVVYSVTYKSVLAMSNSMQGFQDAPKKPGMNQGNMASPPMA
jgi:hypothetical protein